MNTMNQISIGDYIKTLSVKEPEFKKGDVIYKLILDVVEEGVIDHLWEYDNGYGYSAKKSNGCYITFWTPDIESNVFLGRDKAYKEAEKLRNKYKVIRAEDMRIIKEKNFIRPVNDSRVTLEATVKLLENNMVYSEKWYQYPFLEICKNENEAEKIFGKKLHEITHDVNEIELYETDTSIEMQDMYLSKTGLWSNYTYTDFNLPVLKD